MIRVESESSPVSGTKTYSPYTTVDTKTYLSLMNGSYSYTYTKDALLNSISGYEDWMFDYSDTMVGGSGITSDTTYHIDVNRNRYTYSFNANLPSDRNTSDLSGMPNDRTVVASLNGKSDAAVSSPSLPGYRFMGWSTSPDDTGYVNQYPGAEVMKSNKTFYAMWQRAAYTVHFDANSLHPASQTGEYTQNSVSGTMSDQTLDYDVYQNLNANAFTREGYTFAGWNTKPDGSGTSYNDKQSVKNLIGYDNAEITLYAQWIKKLGTETVTVTDEITGNPVSGVSMTLQKKVNGTWTDVTTGTTNASGKITVNDLYWFSYRWVMTGVPAGYRVSSSDTSFMITYNQLSATNSVKLYRIWYKVRYDANGSQEPDYQTGEYKQNTVTGTMADSDYQYGVTGTLRTNAFAREGYTFTGWNTRADGSGTSYKDGYDGVYNWTDADGGIITLYAQWEKKLGTETITVLSEETGNPVSGVNMTLQKNVDGRWTDVVTGTTDSSGKITVNDLHWFDYRWVITSVPAGYEVPSSYETFTITYNRLSAENEVILYMKRVSITLDSRVSDIIPGENPPAFLYHISGRDVAGVSHEYNVMVQTDGTGYGTETVTGLFAGEYSVTQTAVSRYIPGTPKDISNTTVKGIGAVADVKNNTSAEVLFPYSIEEYGWYSGTDSTVNSLTK